MPCNMFEGATSADFLSSDVDRLRKEVKEARDAANKVTDLLCTLLRTMPPETLAGMSPEIQQWFEEHLKHDAAHGR